MQGLQIMYLKETFKFWVGSLVYSIDNKANTITVSNVAGLDSSGGVLIIDGVDANGMATPSMREFISYKSVKNGTLMGVKRGSYGSIAQSHPSGAVMQTIPVVTEVKEPKDLTLNDYLEQLL